MGHDPNFPPNLSIQPLIQQDIWDKAFSSDSQLAAIGKYGIAGRVWEAAYALIMYINPHQAWTFDPPFLDTERRTQMRVIELGSGTGIVGSQIAKVLCKENTDGDAGGSIVVVTDLPEVCPLLEENVRGGAVYVRPLSWGNAEDVWKTESEFCYVKPFTDIICSDLIYFPELFAPLLRTLLHLTSYASPRIIISYKIRSLAKETPFWSTFGLHFTFAPLLWCPDATSELERFGSALEDTTFILVAQRRPESREWIIPDSDDDLLAGVGARGTEAHKGDDAFELLLLMTMEE